MKSRVKQLRSLRALRSLTTFLLIGIISSACHKTGEASGNTDEALQEVRYEYGLPVDSFQVTEGVIGKGETLGGIFARLGANEWQLKQLATLKSEHFKPSQIVVGKRYYAFSQDSLLCYFVYRQDAVRSIVLDVRDTIHVEPQRKEIRREQREADITIESSLWNAMVGAGQNPQLAIELSEVYQWTVDFFGLQKGDRFKVCYEEAFVDSTSIGVSHIWAANYQSGKSTLEAYYFDSLDTHGYFDANGVSLQKTFLKAPLNYKRISSTFTYHRKHPIYKTVRPHTGVDYAAPMGTPVVALGDGVVIEKGYKGGGGNTVKIRHNSTYTTAYLHLSKYGKIAVGQRVKQGEVIGYVGSTGSSTGPHLDFRVWKNGTPVNPLTLESPSAEPVPNAYKAEFDSIVQTYQSKISL